MLELPEVNNFPLADKITTRQSGFSFSSLKQFSISLIFNKMCKYIKKIEGKIKITQKIYPKYINIKPKTLL